MTTWNYSFDHSGRDRYFLNEHCSVEAWVSVLMDDAIRALLPWQAHAPEKKDDYGYFYE